MLCLIKFISTFKSKKLNVNNILLYMSSQESSIDDEEPQYSQASQYSQEPQYSQDLKTEDDDEEPQYSQVIAKDKLRIFDSIHDFWKKRGAQNSSENENGISEDLLENIRNDLNGKIIDLMGKLELSVDGNRDKETPVNKQLESLTNDNNISSVTSASSSFEINVQDYFETHPEYKKYFLADTKMRVSYQEILTLSGKQMPTQGMPEGWNKYINNINSQGILEIYNDTLINNFQQGTYTKYSDILYNNEYKEIINTFILCYMNGSWDRNFVNSEPQAYFTFDAAGKYVKKLFLDDKRMYNLITPQNIADSATTSFNQLNERIEFYFPDNDGSGTPPRKFIVQSDIFNKKNNTETPLEISFINSNFNEQNRYGFNIELKYKDYLANIEFNEKQKEGPSVNYLAGLINDKLETNIRKKNSVVDIFTPLESLFNQTNNKIILQHSIVDSGFLYDLKRMGDHEQCDAAKIFAEENKSSQTILITLDRLCSLYSRMIKQPCIFHNNENLTLYRFPKVIDPIAQENASYYFKIKEIIKFNNENNWVIQLKNDLEKVRTEISDKPSPVYYVETDDDESKQIINSLLTIQFEVLKENIYSALNTIKPLLGDKATRESEQTRGTKRPRNEAISGGGLQRPQRSSVNQQRDSPYVRRNTTRTTRMQQSVENQQSPSSNVDDLLKKYEENYTYTEDEKKYINDQYSKIKYTSSLNEIKRVFNLTFDNNGKLNPLLKDNEAVVNENGTVPKNGSNSYLSLYYTGYRTTYESLTKIFRLIDNPRALDRLKRNKQYLYETIVKTEYFDNLRKITFFGLLNERKNEFSEQIKDVIFVQNNNDDKIIIENFKNISQKLIEMQGLKHTGGDPTRGTKRGREDVEPVESDNTFPGPSAGIQEEMQNKDFGEALFEIMSRCSEFYYSIFLNKFDGNMSIFINSMITDDEYKISINNLYNECSLHLQNNFYDIFNNNTINGDSYTYEYDPIFDYILYLFLYDVSSNTVSTSETVVNSGDGSESEQRTELLHETIYGYDVTKSIDDNTVKRTVAKSINSSSNYVRDPDFINIKEFIESNPYLSNFLITFTFALLYDLSYERLKRGSKFLSIIFPGGINISSYVSNYKSKPEISKLMNRIYIFIKVTGHLYSGNDELISKEFKNMLTGGKKKRRRQTKKGGNKKRRRKTKKRKN